MAVDMGDLRDVSLELDVLCSRLRGLTSRDLGDGVVSDGMDASAGNVGANLMRLRNPVCSQMKLAVMMRADGFKWSAATVWAVESGRQRLKLDEAVSCLRHLGYDATAITELFRPNGGAR